MLPLLRNILWKNSIRPLAISCGLHMTRRVAPPAYRRFQRWYANRQFEFVADWAIPDPQLRDRMRDRVFREAEVNKEWPRPGEQYLQLMRNTHHRIMETETEGYFEFGRATGLRQMLPFWDIDVMDFLVRVHPDVLNAGGRSKGLVRKALARRFPDLGFERQKKLLAGDFFSEIVKKEGAAVHESLGRFRLLREMGVIDGKKFQAQVLDRVTEPIGIKSRAQMWSAFCFEAWLQRREAAGSQ
jgi:hypothetical protein